MNSGDLELSPRDYDDDFKEHILANQNATFNETAFDDSNFGVDDDLLERSSVIQNSRQGFFKI